MEALRHSEIGVTMNTYTHVLAQLREDAAARSTGFSGPEMPPLATLLATVRALPESEEGSDLGALGGTRTPNPLIRSKITGVQGCP
jgi:hypothetical protein